MQLLSFIQTTLASWQRKNHTAESNGLSSLQFVEHSLMLVGRKGRDYRPSTIRNHQTALRSFAEFLPSGDIDIRRITPRLIADYTRWLNRRGVGTNTQSCYVRSPKFHVSESLLFYSEFICILNALCCEARCVFFLLAEWVWQTRTEIKNGHLAQI